LVLGAISLAAAPRYSRRLRTSPEIHEWRAHIITANDILRSHGGELAKLWQDSLIRSGAVGDLRNHGGEIRAQADEFIRLLSDAAKGDGASDLASESWKPVRQFLSRLSEDRVRQGYTSAQTATFVFSLKEPLFTLLRRETEDPAQLATATWEASTLLDKLGLLTVTAFQETREAFIARQQEEVLELSTPVVVKLWDGILALPMIGTLDSARTQIVMESLLQRIVETGSLIAIIDITGVPTVDTLVAQHLLKTVTAIRLMGSDCIISGVRPQIAQTIVHLGVNLQGISTKATLADALALAFERTGRTVSGRVQA
jgi:rsbT co-antagonist protein RsbR